MADIPLSSSDSDQPMATHQRPLVPNGRHDPHLYDPDARDDHQLVAVYETLDQARLARDRLLEAGIPAPALRLVDRTAEPAAESGLWASLKQFLIPDQDAHAYAESVRRGHALLVARPAPDQQVLAIRTLDGTDAIDFDARLEEWRSAGWRELTARQGEGVRSAPEATPEFAHARTDSGSDRVRRYQAQTQAQPRPKG